MSRQVGIGGVKSALCWDVVLLQADREALPGRAVGTRGVLEAITGDGGQLGILGQATISDDGIQSVEGSGSFVKLAGRVGVKDEEDDYRLN